MIDFILRFVNQKNRALDVATGNGQIAVQLATHFKKVYATDISSAQLGNATAAPNLVYLESSAERTGFGNCEFDLITVAQAIHWFDFEKFYKQVHRILKPDGIIAVLGYGLFSTNAHSDAILRRFYYEIVGPYWDAERRYLDDNYTTIPFPFDEITSPKFSNDFQWTFEQLIGYLGTWSATQHYKEKTGNDPVNLIADDLSASWEAGDKNVHFPLLLRIGRLKT